MSTKWVKIINTAAILLFAASLVIMVLTAVHLGFHWSSLTHKIPRGYSFWGEPDLNFALYADREPLVTRLILGSVLGIILAALAIYPQAWNKRATDIPEAAEDDVTCVVRLILAVFELASCVYFSTFITAAIRGGSRWFLTNLVLIAAMLIAVIGGAVLIYRIIRRCEREEEESGPSEE